jgi:two-component system sensor histidine kinase DctS
MTNPRLASSTRRIALVAAAAVAGLVLVAYVGDRAADREAASAVDEMRRAIEAQAVGLRGAATRYGYLPAIVAQHPEVLALLRQPRDPDRVAGIDRYLAEANGLANAEAIYVMDVDGLTVAASNWSEPKSFVGQNYANRPYFLEAKAGGKGLFFGVGVTTGRPGLFLAAPVRDTKDDNRVVGVVAVKVSLDGVAETWRQMHNPLVLTDARGIVVTASDAEWVHGATRPLGRDDRQWLCEHAQYGRCVEGTPPVKPLDWRIERMAGRPEYTLTASLDGRQRTWLALDLTLAGDALRPLGWTLSALADPTPLALARYVGWALAALVLVALGLGTAYWRLRQRRWRELRQTGLELERRVATRTAELQEAHAFRQAMEDSLIVGMRARDLEGRIIYANRAFCEMLGLREDEVVGAMPPYRFWHPDEIERQWELHHQAVSGRAPRSGTEHRFRHCDGHDVNAMVYTAPLIDGQGRHTGWMSSVVDITAQKRAEEREQLQSEQLQHATRLASVGEMASTLAHELNQPLSAMSNFAGAARAFSAQGQQAALAECLDGIRSQAQRAREIINHVRDMARRRSAGFAPTALNEVVHIVLTLVQPELRRHQVRVVLELDPALPRVRGDRILLEQVLVNLLLNAMQAVGTVLPARRQIEIRTAADAARVQLTVTDHGPGVAPSAAERLFEPFNTTRTQGLGLGLSICRTIIESHGGRIRHAARAGGGAVFHIELPVAE